MPGTDAEKVERLEKALGDLQRSKRLVHEALLHDLQVGRDPLPCPDCHRLVPVSFWVLHRTLHKEKVAYDAAQSILRQ